MNAAKLTGRGNYLPKGVHQLQIEKFYFKAAGQKTPMGLFIAEFKAIASTSPEVQCNSMTYSEGFDPTKSGYQERLIKFCLATLGVDWSGAVPQQARDLVADIRFGVEYESERTKLTAKYGHPPENFLIGRMVVAESTPYTTKNKVEIVANAWRPYVAPGGAA